MSCDVTVWYISTVCSEDLFQDMKVLKTKKQTIGKERKGKVEEIRGNTEKSWQKKQEKKKKGTHIAIFPSK